VRIGELADRTGVDARLLRYYERQGLLHPTRRSNGYRDYDEADVATVAFIRRLLAAGLSTTTIAQFRDCGHAAGRANALARLRSEHTRIGAVIADLQAAQGDLEKVIDEVDAADNPAETPPGRDATATIPAARTPTPPGWPRANVGTRSTVVTKRR
jgi:DNA-binding transcriptional MerR regulator